MNSKRILADIALFVSVLWLPWWASAVLAAAFIFMFDWYYEAVVAGFLMDSLYAVPLPRFRGAELVATGAASALYLVAAYVKPKLKFFS